MSILLDLNRYGRDLTNELRQQLIRAGKKASGNLIKSLDWEVVNNGGEYTISILAEDYLIYVDKGRKKGTPPPIQAIREWVSIKGFEEGSEYPIAKGIGENGIDPTNVIDKSINNVDLELTSFVDGLFNDINVSIN